MANRNWLERAWNRVHGLTENDFENCQKLSALTGLNWQPYRAATEHKDTTIYSVQFQHEDVAEAVADKLNDLLSWQEILHQRMSRHDRTFSTAGTQILIKAANLVKLEVKDCIDLTNVKIEVAATLHEAGEAVLRKNKRLLLNNIPGSFINAERTVTVWTPGVGIKAVPWRDLCNELSKAKISDEMHEGLREVEKDCEDNNNEPRSKGVPKIGDEMIDGTIFAGYFEGKPLYATPKDAPKTYTFNAAANYASKFDAHGHNDFRVPSRGELNVLWKNRNQGKLKDTFNEIGAYPIGLYWSSSSVNGDLAYMQYFKDGYQNFVGKENNDVYLRLVRG